jgi:hypothetical protein
VSSSGYEASSYSTSGSTGGYAGGLDSSFGGLNLVDNVNTVGQGGSNSYESYSSQQTYSQ